jgi:CRP-like cAMP-binding protein
VLGAPIELVSSVELFSDLDQRRLREIAGSMKERRFQAGHPIVTEGEGGVGFFVIAEGSATVTVDGQPVRTLGPGDSFGEIALVEETKRTATVAAETDLVCYGLNSWSFRPFVAANPPLATRLREQVERLLGR